ncbi:MAG: hypothetical protein KAT74_01460 [Candidatus Cloacimonetes bacterium]|jgi:hypothetical protein|nr:hypothetical protein [Candidatus Cloacimonadota bacterium]
MGTGQMLLVLFAIVLFSTLIVSTHSNLFNLANINYNAMHSMQGYRIIDKYFQEIDIKIIEQVNTFAEIQSIYSDSTNLMTISYIDYHINIQSNYCDSLGNIATPDASLKYQRVDINIWCNSVDPDTLRIGTPTYPISQVYADLGF